MKLLVMLGKEHGPKDAILIANKAEVIKVKLAHSQSYNYTDGTYNGFINIENIDFLKVNEETFNKLEKLDYDSPLGAIRVKRELEGQLSQLAEANKVAKDIVSGRMDKMIEGLQIADIAKEQAEADHKKMLENRPQKLEQLRLERSTLSEEHEIETVEIIPSVHKATIPNESAEVKAPIKPKEVKANAPSIEKKDGKKFRKNKKKQKDDKITPDNLKQHIYNNKQNEAKKPEQKQQAVKPYKATTIGENADGFFIGHQFLNKEKESQILIVSFPFSDIEKDKTTSLPLIFNNKSTANVMFEALIRHPRHSKLLGGSIVRPVSEIDSALYNADAALVINALTLVNQLEEIE